MLLGIPVRRMVILVWMIAGLLSAASAFLKIAVVGQSLGANIDPSLLLFPLAAAVIARFDDLPTALIAGIGLGILDRAAYYSTNNPNLPVALVLPIVLVALLGRGQMSRAYDSGIASFQTFAESRPVPLQLRRIPRSCGPGAARRLAGLALSSSGPYIGIGTARLGFLTQVVISAIVALSLTLLTGWAGQVSLGQFGIAGIGAAVAGGLATRAHADFFVTLLAGCGRRRDSRSTGGLPALRLPGLFLAVVTLAFSAVVALGLLDPRYFGWMLPKDGQIIERPVLFGRFDATGDRAFYYLCLGFLVLFIASALKLRASRSGRIFVAQRDNIRAAQAAGRQRRADQDRGVCHLRRDRFGRWCAVRVPGRRRRPDDVPGASTVTRRLRVPPSSAGSPARTAPGVRRGLLPSPQLLRLVDLRLPRPSRAAPGLVGVIDEELTALSSGVLIVLSLFPGGVASSGTAVRDRYLRWIANSARHDIELPSLMARKPQHLRCCRG